MVQITVYKNRKGEYTGFETIGHAGYAEAGQDIVCAAISVLTINTINSVSELTTQKFTYEEEAEIGKMIFQFATEGPEEKAELLLASMVLGIQGILESYGDNYLSLNFKEV